MDALVISGLSGSGKSKTASYLEDIGYYTVDNLPSKLMLDFCKYCKETNFKYEHIAFVYDIRAGEPFSFLIKTIEDINKLGIVCKLLFLDTDDESIISRYKETRRNHPLAKNGVSIQKAIEHEKSMLSEVKAAADFVINTSHFSASKLRSEIISLFGKDNDRSFEIHVMSFGYKHGIPLEADLVFDARFMKNPYYVDTLRNKTGLDKDVKEYVLSFDQTKVFILEVEQFLSDFIPLYRLEGKTILIVAIGCTGGHHRSVVCAHELARFLNEKGFNVTETNRDISR